MMQNDGACSMLIFWVYNTQSNRTLPLRFVILNILPL